MADQQTPEARRDGPAAFTERDAAGMHKYVEVQPPEGRHYDTMWGIAERYLGDGMRYKEIVRLNKGGSHSPTIATLKNPDLIYPGWILKLPADAEGPGLRTAEHDARTKAPEHDQHGDQQQGAGHDGDQVAAPGGGGDAGDQAGGGDAAGGGCRGSTSIMTIGGFSTAGALLAAGLLFNLRRRRGWDGGPNPRGGKPLDHEFDLRGAADESSAIFLDKVLRSLGQAAARRTVALPARPHQRRARRGRTRADVPRRVAGAARLALVGRRRWTHLA